MSVPAGPPAGPQVDAFACIPLVADGSCGDVSAMAWWSDLVYIGELGRARPPATRPPARHQLAGAFGTAGAWGWVVACNACRRFSAFAGTLSTRPGRARARLARTGTRDGRLLLLSLQYEDGDGERSGGTLPAESSRERLIAGAHVEVDVSLGLGPVRIYQLVRVCLCVCGGGGGGTGDRTRASVRTRVAWALQGSVWRRSDDDTAGARRRALPSLLAPAVQRSFTRGVASCSRRAGGGGRDGRVARSCRGAAGGAPS